MSTGSSEFGVLLWRYRLAAGLTQEALAERASLSVRGLSDLERSVKTRPHRSTVRQLADALGLSPADRATFIRAARGERAVAQSPVLEAVLPVLPTPFIGRATDIETVRGLLSREAVRLVTLTGPGGSGKTRLAIQVAQHSRGDFDGGIGFVALASLKDAGLVMPTIAATLGVDHMPGLSLLHSIVEFLYARRILLVLDSLEHVLDAAGDLGTVLTACPQLTVLATSRVPLHLTAEQEYSVRPFPVPRQETTNWRTLAQSEAIALFTERARRVHPEFELTEANARWVAEICRQVDGLPLAIELAAARVRLFQEELAERAEISVETGAYSPRPGTVRRLADALGLGEAEWALPAASSHTSDRRDSRGMRAPRDHRVAPAEVHGHQAAAEGAMQVDVAKVSAATTSRSNLPVESTPFIGRAQEITLVRDLVQRHDVRLMTLTGPGGTGKTRLAEQVASSLLDAFADGVIFVDLAPVADPAHVLHAIAAALGLREEEGRTLQETVLAHVEAKDLLLLLDNFEHVLSAAPLVAEIVTRSRRLKVLATSRSLLHLAAERAYDVPPLVVPRQEDLRTTEALLRYDAVALFVERASAAKATFALTDDNAYSIVEICRRLDGLPLAISLAAARVRLLPPEALLKRLDSSLTLLTGGARDVPERQQTLRAAIQWSFGLLSDTEQLLFTQLSVFAGGLTIEAAELVCELNGGFGSGLLDGLGALVDQSLLQMDEGGDDDGRFVMLETIREYATEQLEVTGEVETVRARHAAYYLGLLEETVSQREAAPPGTWAGRLDADVDNLRTALQWSLDHGEAVLRLADCLYAFWTARGAFSEGRRWLELALTQSSPDVSQRARALLLAALLAGAQGDCNEAAVLCRESLIHYREVGDRPHEAEALRYLGWLAMVQGRHADARAFQERSLALSREIGNQLGVAAALHQLAIVEVNDQGDLTEAKTLLEESLALFRALDNELATGGVLNLLGVVELEQDHYERATRYLERALDVLHKGVLSALPVVILGIVAERQAQYERATELFQVALADAVEIGDKRVIAMALLKLGDLLSRLGQCQPAADRYRQSLALWKDVGNAGMIAVGLEGLATLLVEDGNAERSATLLAATAGLRAQFRVARHMDDPYRRKETLVRARQQLDCASWDRAWNRGVAMAADEAVMYAVEGVDLGASVVASRSEP